MLEEKRMEFQCKQDFLDLLERLVAPLRERYTSTKSGLRVGNTGAYYDKTTIEMEGFSRILWGLVPMWKGGGTILPGFDELYRQGLSSGTDPESSGYWGGFHDKDQHFVEMAAIALGLILTPDKLWNPLSEGEKQHLVTWLNGINQYTLCESNWQLFNVLVNVALKKLGREYSREKMEYGLSLIESYYQGDGWYTDGISKRRDYYVSFAIHYYCLLYSVFMEEDDPQRARRFRERAVEFGQQFVYWFAEDGASIAYGRSLTYRFAQCSFWSACLFAGVEPFPIGVMKGIIARHFKDWMSYPIFDSAGLLTIGYRYPNLHMAESYNAPGSPYWSLKAFLLLALSDEHPVWQVESQPLPPLDRIKTLEHANMVMTRSPEHVCAYVSGQYGGYADNHASEKYSKFVYSTKYGFSVPRSQQDIHENAPDSMLAFVIDGMVFVRRGCSQFQIEDNAVTSTWSPFEGIEVETTVIPDENGHTRRHVVTSEYDCAAYDCGFSVPMYEPGAVKRTQEVGMAKAENGTYGCTVFGESGTGEVLDANPNTNLMFPNSVIPAVRYGIKKGRQEFVTRVEAK